MGQWLSNLAIGSLVKLNENGHPEQFIKLDNDHYGEGTGCTMLRKYSFTPIFLSESNTHSNCYRASLLDNFCDSVWFMKLDAEIQDNVINTPIPTLAGTIGMMEWLTTSIARQHHIYYRKGFSLSMAEIFDEETISDLSSIYAYEGTHFEYFSDNSSRIARIENYNKTHFWGLRTPMVHGTTDLYNYKYAVTDTGSYFGTVPWQTYWAPRPAFNLRSDIIVSDTTDSDGCYTVESIPTKSGNGMYVKQNGVWVLAS